MDVVPFVASHNICFATFAQTKLYFSLYRNKKTTVTCCLFAILFDLSSKTIFPKKFSTARVADGHNVNAFI